MANNKQHVVATTNEILDTKSGKTLDRIVGKVLRENKQEDIPTLVFEGTSSPDLFIKYASNLVKIIYDEVKFIKFESKYGSNITPGEVGGKVNIHINTYVAENSNGAAPTPVLMIGCSTLGVGGAINLITMSNQLNASQVTNGNSEREEAWTSIYNVSYKDIFEAAGLTVEDFLRKFVPDSPYLK